MNSTKDAVILACQNLVASQKKKVLDAIAASREAANGETKSSAGDKYETTRAMMHFELEKLTSQLTQIEKSEAIIYRAQHAPKQTTIGFGDLVHTENAAYFLAVGLGKISIDNTTVFVLSATSPLGQNLVGKCVGDVLSFNGKAEKITAVL